MDYRDQGYSRLKLDLKCPYGSSGRRHFSFRSCPRRLSVGDKSVKLFAEGRRATLVEQTLRNASHEKQKVIFTQGESNSAFFFPFGSRVCLCCPLFLFVPFLLFYPLLSWW